MEQSKYAKISRSRAQRSPRQHRLTFQNKPKSKASLKSYAPNDPQHPHTYLPLLTGSDIQPEKQSTFQNRQGLPCSVLSKSKYRNPNTYRQLLETLTLYIHTHVLHPRPFATAHPGLLIGWCARDMHACCPGHVSKVTYRRLADLQVSSPIITRKR